MTVQTEAKWVGRAQGAAVIVALVALAQFWPGWQLDSAAKKEIAAAYDAGFVVAQGPICAAQFMAQADAEAKLAELNSATGPYNQMKFIPEALRTLPGHDRVDYALGVECLNLIKASSESAQM